MLSASSEHTVQVLFRPRKCAARYISHDNDSGNSNLESNGAVVGYDGSIPTADGEFLGYRLLVPRDPQGGGLLCEAPLLLYFHGNAEVAADVSHMGVEMAKCGLSILAVDFRGYGWSSGSPQLSDLVKDAHAIMAGLPQVFQDVRIQPAALFVMGRSLGSVWALELASSQPEAFEGLILESAFADLKSLPVTKALLLRGIPAEMAKKILSLEDPTGNLQKMERCQLPLLLIHGTRDELVPFIHGQQLFDACPSPEKVMVTIKGAGHNDIMRIGYNIYFEAMSMFVKGGGAITELRQHVEQMEKRCCVVS